VLYSGQPINIDIPMFVELMIARTDPGVRGDTAREAPSRPPWKPVRR